MNLINILQQAGVTYFIATRGVIVRVESQAKDTSISLKTTWKVQLPFSEKNLKLKIII